MVWVKFAICAVLILLAGRSVAKYADVIAIKTGMSRLWIGIIIVSVATSLPELFTGIGSVTFADAPDMAIGNVFGANSYNMLNIAILDILSGKTPILSALSSGQLLTAALSLILVMLATAGIALSKGGFSVVIFVSYFVLAWIIYKNEPKSVKQPDSAGTAGKAIFYFIIAAFVIAATGIWLAYIGKELSTVFHLGESFVGSLFLGLTTTLPEITVSVAALLMGAKEIAIANMIGSNLFNMTIIFVDDMLYAKAPILEAVSGAHVWQGCIVMAMTAIVIIAMVTKVKRKFFNVSWYTPALVIIFLLGTYISFQMR